MVGKGDTARLERHAAVSDSGQQTPAKSQPRSSTQVLRNEAGRPREWFRTAYGIRFRAQAKA
jgi:hypothetical protein